MVTVKQPRKRRPNTVKESGNLKSLVPGTTMDDLVLNKENYIGKWVYIIHRNGTRMALLKGFYRLGNSYVLELKDPEEGTFQDKILNSEIFQKKQSMALDVRVYDLSRWGFLVYDRSVTVMLSWLDSRASASEVAAWVQAGAGIWASYFYDLNRKALREEESRTKVA